ncbi:nuclear pore complex protein NUP133 isoform X2 [Ricinus communis]|uniref:nuclear pore complex protein NUP133 isoform X2 n=1 Tax=Ricinus communis TaxID=3988 RepID=UPI00201A4AC4|nr:nuclear pore complex protein NUP133 isoform X2 [Ricinus communis]
MFSPGTKRRTNLSSRKERNLGQKAPDSPITPLQDNRNSLNDNSIPNRPATGTPAPWGPRLSVLARIPPANRSEKGNEVDPIKPVYVGEFPQVVRDEQATYLQKHITGDACIYGGMDKDTCLSWIICGKRLFIWSYLSTAASKECVVLEFPSNVLDYGDFGKNSCHGSWMLCIVSWDKSCRGRNKVVQSRSSFGVVICNQKTQALIYWPDIYSAEGSTPVTNLLSSDDMEVTSSPIDGKITQDRHRQRNQPESSSIGLNTLNSLIASAVPASQQVSVALACSSNGELWQFYCSPTGIERSKVYQDKASSSFRGNENGQCVGSKGYLRSLIWHSSLHSVEDTNRKFLMLTDHEIQCFTITFRPDLNVSKLWSHEIVGNDGDSGIKKDLAGQKRIWPLDLQVDDQGKVITVLVASFCKDRVSGSSYIQYSLLTMQYKYSVSIDSDVHERILEKKAPIQVIIPKARVEDEDFLFSMRLRVGGRPSGSGIILSGDGTATVSHYYRNSPRLYQFDLPYDAGKVLDASILPSPDGSEDGAWVVLTEKAGIWAIPEKAVVLGGVEPPERSLSRKGSSNEGSTEEERRNITFSGDTAPRRASSEAWDAGGRQKAAVTGLARRTAQDEESEALLSQLFHHFLLNGQVDASFVKLQNSGAFERDGETNVFTRTSKSIVDTLAKHWTTTRGAEIVALTIVSSQLMDKQQKHERYLQFLALSKCHEELCSKQRHSLQIILEHGEKLAGMVQLREMQNVISQNRSVASGSLHSGSEAQISGAIWDLIQLVGERARRNTVLLMDRDNAEVFYSKVSDLEEIFNCLDRHLEYVISEEQLLEVQIQRACELSDAVVSVVRTVMLYRDEHHMWYPPPEGLTPWYCQLVVRNGLWRVASFMLQLLNETTGFNNSIKSDLYSHLEVLAEVLLETYAGAITGKLERGEEHKSLLEEYWNRRDSLLGSLYQKLKDFVEGGHQVFNVGTNEQNDELQRKLSSSLLGIAKRHEGYNTMWSICCDLNDAILLKNLMNESMGPNGGFSYFVFKQLYQKRQFSKLLRVGEEFPEELSFFLKHHHELLWLHEVFLHQFPSASETLHALALSQDEYSILETEEGAEPESTGMIKSSADRKRLLNLSKISVMAGKNADFETKVKRIDADLKILKLQEEILKVLQANGVEVSDGQQLFRPEELIEHCLKVESPELALQAFDVFAWTSSSFRRSHRSLLEECWKNAADQDDWGKLHQASIDEGWSDEETLQQLRDTVLFQVSSRCYGPRAETIEEGFDKVLPLRKENSEVSALKGLDFSVEAVLMQHKDFPDAGKLMLTAIMLGSVHDDTKVEEGTSPME